MSLLPIIYSSLLITGAFLFLVLIVSYISYKIKNNKASNLPVSGNLEPKLSLAVASSSQPKPIIVAKSKSSIMKNEYALRVFDGRKENYGVVHESNKRKNPIERKNIATPNTRMTHIVTIDNPNSNHLDKKPDYMQRTSIGIFQNRIEVLNTKTNEIKPSVKAAPKNKADMESNDMLSYYNDNNESGFYTLKSAGFAQ